MPFIVQCENTPCRKYNLVEDELRGRPVKCLICRTVFRAEYEVRTCPNCAAKMRVPASVSPQRIQCPRCQTVFQ